LFGFVRIIDLLAAMYSYHNRIKQRIKNEELTGFEYVEQYKDIKPCLLLYFSTEPTVRPIREHRFEMYDGILHNGLAKHKRSDP
jgi:hypothetical protein